MSKGQTPAELAGYAADVAKALKGLESRDLWWGNVYISEVRFGYDSEDAGIRLVPDDGGSDFDVMVYFDEEELNGQV